MAPAGPPPDPPDGPRRRGDREADDWDWGGDWDAHDPAADRSGGASPDGTAPGSGDAPDTAGPTTDGAPPPPMADPDPSAARPDADGPPSRPAHRDGRPTARPGGRSPRRPVVLAAAVVALLLAVVGWRALAGGDAADDDRTVATATTDGGELRALTGLAARAAEDQADRAVALRRYARLGLPVYCGAGRRRWVALTFDDGPGPLSGRWIAEMAKAGAPMTLFRIGRNVPGNEEFVRVQRNLGWDSGSHTQDHPALATLGARDQRRQIERGAAASRRVLGRPPVLFRPPYESHDRTTDRIVERLGLVEVLWNVDTQDSLGSTSTDEIVRTAVQGMRPGSIILMHEVKPNTLAAMPRILEAMRRRDLRPVTVSEMLAGDGPSAAQLRRGYDGCAVDLTPGTASS